MRVKKQTTVVIAVVIFTFIIMQNITLLQNTVYDVCVTCIKVINLYSVKDYNSVETKHFKIKYSTSDSDIVPIIADTIEKHFDSTSQSLQYTFYDKPYIVIYPDIDTMRGALKLRESDYPIGMYYAGIISVLSPKQWIKTDDLKDLKYVFENEGPMVHEFVHLIVDRKAHGNFPLWFTEGMAQYYEYKISEYKGKSYVYSGRDMLNKLRYEFNDINQQEAYGKSYMIVKLIADRYGESKLVEIVEKLGKRKINNGDVTLENIIYNLLQ